MTEGEFSQPIAMPGELLPDTQPKFSPLHQIHVDAGASFTDFAGWQMPVRYSSDLAEHHAVRSSAALFDLSHMAEIIVDGPQAGAALDYALAGNISAMRIGQAKYSLILTPDGGIVDDVVVYRLLENRYGVVANAGNRFPAAGAISARAKEFDTIVVDESDRIALIAVQGPASRSIVEKLNLAVETPIADLTYYSSTLGTYEGDEILVGRTGYTGEDGFELYVRNEFAPGLWAELMAAGKEFGIVPAGLASRDTLRLEAGMPLYGHELSTEIFPAQAGLGRVVNLNKESSFVGRNAIEASSENGTRLVGLTAAGKRAGRAEYVLYASAEGGEPVGEITSGALSPTLGYPIAMAYVENDFAAAGTELFMDVRGTRIPATVTALPFYKRESK
jgi:aminomethyltransferase